MSKTGYHTAALISYQEFINRGPRRAKAVSEESKERKEARRKIEDIKLARELGIELGDML
jgi:hypothetical protein